MFPLPLEVDQGDAYAVAHWLLKAVHDAGGNAIDLAEASWTVEPAEKQLGHKS